VFPGGAREWDWNETGTTHEPGIQPADVAELLDHGATTIVLSQGRLKRLHVCPQTLQLLQERGVRTDVLPHRGGDGAVQPVARPGASGRIISHDVLATNFDRVRTGDQRQQVT